MIKETGWKNVLVLGRTVVKEGCLDLVWTASGGFVVKVKDGLAFYMRLGAASSQNIGVRDEINTKPIPFLAIDFGSIRF